MNIAKLILTNSKFWAALLILANGILIYFVPNFPPAIWASFDALVSVTLAIMAGANIVSENRANQNG